MNHNLPKCQADTHAGHILPSSFDMKRVLQNVNQFLNPLRDDFLLQHHVSKAANGYVFISFALPEEMTRCFINFLESMAGFFRIVDVKARSTVAQERAVSLDEIEKRENRRNRMNQLVCLQFDKHIKLGRTRNEAISLTNASLKEKGHAWVTYEIVKDILRATGKFRKKI